jgi:hypothetical protein
LNSQKTQNSHFVRVAAQQWSYKHAYPRRNNATDGMTFHTRSGGIVAGKPLTLAAIDPAWHHRSEATKTALLNFTSSGHFSLGEGELSHSPPPFNTMRSPGCLWTPDVGRTAEYLRFCRSIGLIRRA